MFALKMNVWVLFRVWDLLCIINYYYRISHLWHSSCSTIFCTAITFFCGWLFGEKAYIFSVVSLYCLILLLTGCICFSRSIGDASLCKKMFEEYVTQLKEEAKENERKRKEERVWILLISSIFKNWLLSFYASHSLYEGYHLW